MNRPYAAKLQELLQASYNLPNAVCDLGRIELGPIELKEITRRIYAHETGGIDAKAHYLLAASGFNAEQVLSEIAELRFDRDDEQAAQPAGNASNKGINTAKPGSVAPKEPVKEPSTKRTPPSDNYSGKFAGKFGAEIASSEFTGDFGVQPRQNNNKQVSPNTQPPTVTKQDDPESVLVMQTSREFDEFVEKRLKVDWTTHKREVLKVLGRSRDAETPKLEVVVDSHDAEYSLLGPPATSSRPLTGQQQQYAAIVTELCDRELEMPDVVQKFGAVAQRFSTDARSTYICDGWRALKLNNPLKFLEQQFWDHINAEIRAHRQSAKPGGMPSSFSKVKAFVSLKYWHNDQWDTRLTVVNKTPIWAYLYYLVRSGHIEDALKLVLERTDIFVTVGSSFAVYFKAWAESSTQTLSPHYTELIHAEYHQQFKPGTAFDPYRQALFKIIGRCDLSKRNLPLVAVTTEDWLWLQLRLCRQDNDTATTAVPASRYTLEDVRSYILDIGPTHLASDAPKYFTILGLLGLWTQAVAFLATHAETQAVHFAIALLATRNKEFKGSVGTLIGHYTRHFREKMPSLAVDYLVMLALAPSTENDATKEGKLPTRGQLEARVALQELVLETRRFSELLGDVTTFTDKPVAGCIQKRMTLIGLTDKREYLNCIALPAADKANRLGHTLDAILLYRLAEQQTKVFELVNTHLGILLSGVPLGQHVSTALASSSEFVQLARNVMRIDGDSLASAALKKAPLVPNSSRETCLLLLAIVECLDLLASREWNLCLERINQTGLLVLSPEPAVDQVRELAQKFLSYDESLACNIPNVLLMAMTCIVRNNEILQTQGTTPVASRLMEQNRGRANNCMVYAGLIQFRMPREVYAKLTQLDAL